MSWRRVTIRLDKQDTKKLKKLQRKTTKKTKEYQSFSKILEMVLEEGLKKK